MPQQIKKDDLYVVIISSIEERNKLYELCVKNNIPVLYKETFKEKHLLNRLFGLSKTGVGLVGTIIARHTPKDHILYFSKDSAKVEEIISNLSN